MFHLTIGHPLYHNFCPVLYQALLNALSPQDRLNVAAFCFQTCLPYIPHPAPRVPHRGITSHLTMAETRPKEAITKSQANIHSAKGSHNTQSQSGVYNYSSITCRQKAVYLIKAEFSASATIPRTNYSHNTASFAQGSKSPRCFSYSHFSIGARSDMPAPVDKEEKEEDFNAVLEKSLEDFLPQVSTILKWKLQATCLLLWKNLLLPSAKALALCRLTFLYGIKGAPTLCIILR